MQKTCETADIPAGRFPCLDEDFPVFLPLAVRANAPHQMNGIRVDRCIFRVEKRILQNALQLLDVAGLVIVRQLLFCLRRELLRHHLMLRCKLADDVCCKERNIFAAAPKRRNADNTLR